MKRINVQLLLAILASFVVLLFIFFFRQIVFDKVLYCCDNLTINVPSKVFLASELKQGRLPLWNPYIFSGSPYLADINLGIFYPLNVLYLLLTPFRALTVGVILSYGVSLFGAYLLARRIGLSTIASFYSSLVYTFSGTIASYTNNVSILHVAALMPLVLWSIVNHLDKSNLKNFLIASLCIGLQIISGHPQITYLTIIVSILLIVTYPKISIADRIKHFFPMFIFSAGLTAIQWIPFIESASLSSRAHASLDYASS